MNPRLNLAIYRSLVTRIDKELLFLGEGGTSAISPDIRPGNRAEFIKATTGQAIRLWQDGQFSFPHPERDEGRIYVSCYLGVDIRGLWQHARDNGFAGLTSFSRIAETAIAWHFNRIDARTRRDKIKIDSFRKLSEDERCQFFWDHT
jgi:hypothetical protein